MPAKELKRFCYWFQNLFLWRVIQVLNIFLIKAKSLQKLNWSIAFWCIRTVYDQTYTATFFLFFSGAVCQTSTRGWTGAVPHPSTLIASEGYQQLPHLHNNLPQPAAGPYPSKQLLSSTTPDCSSQQLLRRQHHLSCRDASLGRQHQASRPFLKTIRAKRQALTAKLHRYYTFPNAVNICLLQVPNLGLLWLLSPQTILIERGL